METRSLPGPAAAIFDGAILHAISSMCYESDEEEEITDTLRPVLVGLRNERGEIYRHIQTTTMREHLRLSQVLRAMGFRDELGTGRVDGCDSVFSLDVTRPGSQSMLGSESRLRG
jgi:hypothetical protein